MSIPRSLSVKKINARPDDPVGRGEWILIQKPVEKIKTLRQLVYSTKTRIIEKTIDLPLNLQQFEMEVVIQANDNAIAGVRLAAGNNHAFEVGYDTYKKVLYVDRSKSANQSFNKNFSKLNRFEIPYSFAGNKIRLRIFVDNSIVEVFVNGGERVFTTQIFPGEKDTGIELFSDTIYSTLVSCSVYKIKSAW